MGVYVGLVRERGAGWSARLFDMPHVAGDGQTIEDAIAAIVTAFWEDIRRGDAAPSSAPPPTALSGVLRSGEIGPDETPVLIPLGTRDGPAMRINITIPSGLLRDIDTAAQRSDLTRSAWITEAARAKLASGR